MPGPLIRVKTITSAINLDISRKLNMGRDKTLRFVVPDTTQVNNWRILLTLTRGFDRIVPEETVKNDGQTIIIRVADLNGAIGTIIREKDLHVELEDLYYRVASTPLLPSNKAQVYNLTCKVRVLRTAFDTSR